MIYLNTDVYSIFRVSVGLLLYVNDTVLRCMDSIVPHCMITTCSLSHISSDRLPNVDFNICDAFCIAMCAVTTVHFVNVFVYCAKRQTYVNGGIV